MIFLTKSPFYSKFTMHTYKIAVLIMKNSIISKKKCEKWFSHFL